MGNIQDKETHFTFRSKVGSIADSFFYLTHWYARNYLLITLVQGKAPSEHGAWLEYLRKRGVRHELLGTACLIHPESVEQVFVDENTFNGLNEVYVCHRKPSPADVPGTVYPADKVEFGEDLPEGFLEGLRALDALAYLSDGDGVNIAHKAKEEIIYFVREMSM